MTATKKQTIRLEKLERLVLPNVFQRFCLICQTEQIFVSTEQATFLTNLSTREIFRLVELNAIHFFETEEGFTNICLKSLIFLLEVENVNFVLHGKFLEGNGL